MSENNHIPSCLTLAVVSRGAKWLKRGREGGREGEKRRQRSAAKDR